MATKIKLLLLVLMPLLLFNLGYGLNLALEKPSNSTYTTSINIPLEFTATDSNGTCTYKINGGGIVNLPACEDTQFNLDFDGSYKLELFAYNDTDIFNKNVTFGIDRTSEFEEGKPFLTGIIILVFLGLSFLFLNLGNSFREEGFQLIKPSCSFAALISMITTISLAIVAANEYLKFSSVITMLSVYNRALTGILVFILFIMFIMFMFGLIKKMKFNIKGKW